MSEEQKKPYTWKDFLKGLNIPDLIFFGVALAVIMMIRIDAATEYIYINEIMGDCVELNETHMDCIVTIETYNMSQQKQNSGPVLNFTGNLSTLTGMVTGNE